MSNKRLFIIALIIAIFCSLLTGCQSSGLASTCDRFGMDTATVTVYAVSSETRGASKTITQFKCLPRKYKD
jgi:hypothetical protein